MTIEVLNRSFVFALPNDNKDKYLHIRCHENHMSEMGRFIRFSDLGFKQLYGDDNVINTAHKVSSAAGVVEAPNGKIYFEIIDGIVHFKPLNGEHRDNKDYVFKVSLEELASTLAKETNLGRWDDYCLGSLSYNGRQVYFYTNLLLKNIITITNRRSYYITMQNDDSSWKRGEFYITKETWYELAQLFRRDPNMLPPHDEPIYGWMHAVMREHDFESVDDLKKYFNQL